ncbi:STAS domain-containing protein [Kitasatospora sp. NBC_01287]|uniref:STAS domain-containing protein n=1 Tax=Kitasatospora sp. NBC_01287 TaxID=2903573 RepID=UPI002B1E1742|nr:STAS domain-containing protein [Kitasatospora sp. NBC_01287]
MTTDGGPFASLPVIAASGEPDADTLGPLTAELEAAAASHPVVILDASGITFGDSAFLRTVTAWSRTTSPKPSGGARRPARAGARRPARTRVPARAAPAHRAEARCWWPRTTPTCGPVSRPCWPPSTPS